MQKIVINATKRHCFARAKKNALVVRPDSNSDIVVAARANKILSVVFVKES